MVSKDGRHRCLLHLPWYVPHDVVHVMFSVFSNLILLTKPVIRAAALDPNYKVAYANAKLAASDFRDGMKRLENVVSP